MRLLLDTHAVLWWLLGDEQLSRRAREVIAARANEIFVSSVSAMEVATKYRLGKLPEAEGIAGRFIETVEAHGFRALPMTLEHGDRAGLLSIPHRDPFDRLLIAQALVENLGLVSNEKRFDVWGVVRRLW